MKEHKIPAGNCQGYIWKSDVTEPQVWDGVFEELILTDGENPFVLEGQLFNTETLKSYSIKYVDGQYLVKEYQVSADEQTDGCEERVYYSNRMGDMKLKFIQRWREEDNSDCLNWPVLAPKELVFVGFKN